MCNVSGLFVDLDLQRGNSHAVFAATMPAPQKAIAVAVEKVPGSKGRRMPIHPLSL